ncbi:hypothetical protein FRC12_022503, partial [Ceratobasidium sp. 428]
MDHGSEVSSIPGTSPLARVPTNPMRRKSSASNLLTNINKPSASPASPPPIRDPAPAVPDWDVQSVFSDASGGTGVAGTIASSAGLLSSGGAIPPTPAIGTGTSVEALQH